MWKLEGEDNDLDERLQQNKPKRRKKGTLAKDKTPSTCFTVRADLERTKLRVTRTFSLKHGSYTGMLDFSIYIFALYLF